MTPVRQALQAGLDGGCKAHTILPKAVMNQFAFTGYSWYFYAGRIKASAHAN